MTQLHHFMADLFVRLRAILFPFIHHVLERKYGEDWEAKAKEVLLGRNQTKTVEEWDIIDLLNILRKQRDLNPRNYKAISSHKQEDLYYPMRAHGSLLRSKRNKFAHQQEITIETVDESFGDALKFLKLLEEFGSFLVLPEEVKIELAEGQEKLEQLRKQFRLDAAPSESKSEQSTPEEPVEPEASDPPPEETAPPPKKKQKKNPSQPRSLDRLEILNDLVRKVVGPKIVRHATSVGFSPRHKISLTIYAESKEVAAIYRAATKPKGDLEERVRLHLSSRGLDAARQKFLNKIRVVDVASNPPKKNLPDSVRLDHAIVYAKVDVSSQGSAWLKVLKGRLIPPVNASTSNDSALRRIPADESAPITIGRAPKSLSSMRRENTISFMHHEDPSLEPELRTVNGTVSHEHAEIKYDENNGRFYIVDENSRHGVVLFQAGGRRRELPPFQPTALRPGDRIHLGKAILLFTDKKNG